MRSIPEKTLEHWTSIYLSNRFPNGALWWPTSGEDVLVELPRLAATGPGKTLALELKTTEAVGDRHMLEIDTVQLDRYLNPNLGPLSPVYYVFPLPHWVGPLTSTSGSSPASLGGSAPAPPEWWRRRIGRSWFGEWLYVMSARAVSEALPVDWRSKGRAKLFTLDPTRPTSWATLFTRAPYSVPYLWRSFWSIVTKCGPWDSIRWRTVVDGQGRPDRVLVLDGDLEEGWHLGALLDQRRQLVKEQVIDHGVERAILHIPDSALY